MEDRYSRRIHFYSADIPELLLRYLENSDWQSILDLGCGDGALLYALNHRNLFKNKTVCAVDISKTRIGRVKTINKDFRCWVDNACSVHGLPSQKMDFVISNQVIEHVEEDRAMVREIKRLIKPNGICYLSTVFKKKYGWYFYRLNGRWVLDPTHVREYTHQDQLLDILQAYDFKILENRRTPIRYPLIELLLRKVWPNRNALEYKILKFLRRIRIPIIGYDCWELVIQER